MFLGEARVPDGVRVYAVGDIHGRADLLDRMLELVAADRAAAPGPVDRLVFLGDYTDRGRDSRGVLERLSGLSADPGVVCLRGNHDEWLEAFLRDPESGDGFLTWGGLETIASYGVEIAPHRSNAEMARDLSRAMPTAHRKFLARLRHWHVEGDYFFCHAGVRPGIALEAQDPHDLMWIRGDFHGHRGSFGKVVVHGHTPQAAVEVLANRINVDTRAFDSGMLSCVVLEGDRHRLIQT